MRTVLASVAGILTTMLSLGGLSQQGSSGGLLPEQSSQVLYLASPGAAPERPASRNAPSAGSGRSTIYPISREMMLERVVRIVGGRCERARVQVNTGLSAEDCKKYVEAARDECSQKFYAVTPGVLNASSDHSDAIRVLIDCLFPPYKEDSIRSHLAIAAR